jgi:hypothetical protein
MTFSISALVLARDSHIKPDSDAGGLIWDLHIWCFVYNGPFVILTKNFIDIVYRL